MKVLGIHILKDHTLQILLESARNNAFNEAAYQKVLNEKHDLAACGERLSKEKGPAFANPLLMARPGAIEPTTH